MSAVVLAAGFGQPTPSWNPLTDLHLLLTYHFMVDALVAGTVVALVAAPIGWFMVLRGQTFAGHTLAVVGFPGAAGAVLLGISATYGYLTFCVAAALVIAAVPRTRHARGPGSGEGGEEGAVIGTTQAFALACGYLFATLYAGNLSGVESLLFGSFLGVTTGQVVVLGVVGAAVLVVLAVVGRPLLFASVDPEVARARGVPVGWLSVLFLVVLGVAAAEASQITGSLLVFALLVLPAATAQVLSPRPAVSLVLAVGLALAVTWIGLAVAYFSTWPIGFWISSVAFGLYVLARAGDGLRSGRARRRARGRAPARPDGVAPRGPAAVGR